MDFSRKPESIEEILRVIARAPTGREVLERFLPLRLKGQVRIEDYPEELRARLRAALGEGQPIGAAFIPGGTGGTESDTGVIYLDLQSPMGVLAPFLVHEMTHALNPRIWEASRRGMTASQRDELTAVAEVEAFEKQFQFTQELRERTKEFSVFLETAFPKARVLHERLGGDDVSALYGIARRKKQAS